MHNAAVCHNTNPHKRDFLRQNREWIEVYVYNLRYAESSSLNARMLNRRWTCSKHHERVRYEMWLQIQWRLHTEPTGPLVEDLQFQTTYRCWHNLIAQIWDLYGARVFVCVLGGIADFSIRY